MSRVISYREVYENNNKQILLSEEQYNVLKMDNVQLSVLVNEKDKEIERLNNNWNELEKWIEKERDKWEKYNPDCFVYYQSILDRMEEFKGVDKE